MTNKERAQALWAIAGDEGRSFLERQQAAAELLDLQRASKVGWAKLGLPDGARQALEARLGPEPTSTHDLGGGLTIETNVKGFEPLKGAALRATIAAADPLDEAPAKPAEGGERGLISAEVRRLLATDLPYASIVEAVRARFPSAATTARSVASVAAEMRAKGQAVPSRRRAAA